MAKTDKTQPVVKERTSMYLDPATVWGLKYVALMDAKTQTDIIQEALNEYLGKWEKKNGPVPPQKA